MPIEKWIAPNLTWARRFTLFSSITSISLNPRIIAPDEGRLTGELNLVKFSKGKIDISFNDNLDKDFVRNLSEKLYQWTGNRWVITLTKQMGQKTFSELESIKKKEIIEKEKKGDVYKKFENIFSDIELVEVKKKD